MEFESFASGWLRVAMKRRLSLDSLEAGAPIIKIAKNTHSISGKRCYEENIDEEHTSKWYRDDKAPGVLLSNSNWYAKQTKKRALDADDVLPRKRPRVEIQTRAPSSAAEKKRILKKQRVELKAAKNARKAHQVATARELLSKESDEIPLKKPKQPRKSIRTQEREIKKESELADRINNRRKSLARHIKKEEDDHKAAVSIREVIAPKIKERAKNKTFRELIKEFYPSVRLSDDPTSRQLKNAFKRGMAAFHPDKIRYLQDMEKSVEAEEIYKLLQAAYEKITNAS